MATLFYRWHAGSTTHGMHHDGSYAYTHPSSGIDQGCPLPPCGFAAAVDPISWYILSETHRMLDRGAKLWAYLDDRYIWLKPQHIPEATDLISGATRTINLALLQPTKVPIWTASCTNPTPPVFLDKAKPTLKCLGAHISVSLETVKATPWKQAGLKMQTLNDLLIMYVGAASRRALRMTFVPEAEALSFDTEIAACWSQLAGRDVTSPLFHLTLRMKDLGVGSAAQRHAAAPWTAWQSVIPTLLDTTDPPDTDALFAAMLILRSQLLHLQSSLAQQMELPSRPPQTIGCGPSHPRLRRKRLSAPSNAPCTNSSWTATLTTPFRRPSSFPNGQEHRRPLPAAQQRSTRRGRQVLPGVTSPPTYAGSPTRERPSQHLDHVPQRSELPSEYAPAPSMPIGSTASYARVEGGVDQRHSALARCLADLVTTHTGAMVYNEQTNAGHPREPQAEVRNPKGHE